MPRPKTGNGKKSEDSPYNLLQLPKSGLLSGSSKSGSSKASFIPEGSVSARGPETHSNTREWKKKLVEAQTKRKQVSQDALVLANRINLLKQEEAKANRKIEETKARALKVHQMKEEKKARVVRTKKISSERSKPPPKVRTSEGGLSMKNRNERIKCIEDDKRERILQAKEEKLQLRERLEQNRREEDQRVMATRLQAQKNRDQGRKRIVDGKAKKMEELGKKHLQKAKEEEKTTKYKEKEVMEMQRIEMELLERIAKAQVKHKKAYQQLETALK